MAVERHPKAIDEAVSQSKSSSVRVSPSPAVRLVSAEMSKPEMSVESSPEMVVESWLCELSVTAMFESVPVTSPPTAKSATLASVMQSVQVMLLLIFQS